MLVLIYFWWIKENMEINIVKIVFLYIFIVKIIYTLIVAKVNVCYFIKKVFCCVFFKKNDCNTLIAF